MRQFIRGRRGKRDILTLGGLGWREGEIEIGEQGGEMERLRLGAGVEIRRA
jgi:hypothetical protein